ncbi:MAG: hypothetical protein O3A00_07770, partial [Planctomycetota bacterium]|nr:hypothetical protein [Planctomycetota bacterium]
MASPFSIFRKNQKTMMVLLCVMAIFAFTLDSLFNRTEPNRPLLGMLIGSGVLVFIGMKRGKAIEFAVGGAAVGLAIGFLSTQIDGVAPVVVTSKHEFSRQDLNALKERRQAANDFMKRANSAASTPAYSFGPVDDSVLLGELLHYEADELGINVSPELVKAFIGDQTAKSLTKDELAQILKQVKYKGQSPSFDTLVREILAPELRSQLALQMIVPNVSVTPEQYWNAYRKLHVGAEITASSIPIDAFMDRVGEPSDGEIQALFEKHKSTFPNPYADEGPQPGFRLGRRVDLAYVEIVANDLIETVDSPTDEEVTQYYEANKETKYKVKSVDLDSKSGPSFPNFPNFDDPPKPSAPKDATSQPETKTDTNKTTGEKGDPKPAPKLVPPLNTPDDGKPAIKPIPNEKLPPAPKPEPKNPPPAPKKAADPKGDGSQDGCQDDKAEPSPSKTTAKQPAEKKTTETKTTEAAQPVLKVPDSKTKPESSPKSTAEPETKSPEVDPKVKSIPDAPKALEPKAEPEGPKYQPLDDFLREEIIQTIRRERAEVLVKSHADQIVAQMDKFSDLGFELQQQGKEADAADLQAKIKRTDDTMSALAAKLKAFYATTGLVSEDDFRNTIDYPLSGARALGSTMSDRTTLVDVFGSSRPPRYMPRVVVSPNDEYHRYVYWLIADEAAHEPTLKEKGVRDLVIKAWKQTKARELATKRAERLKDDIEAGLAAGL